MCAKSQQQIPVVISNGGKYFTRSSGPYGPFLLAPEEGFGAFGPCMRPLAPLPPVRVAAVHRRRTTSGAWG